MGGKKHNGVVLIVMDGWGLSDKKIGNAIAQAQKPNYDRLWSTFPHAVLESSGESVGLPVGQMGTSEVNHLTIGAGRVIYQDLVRINKAIKDGTFYQLPSLITACENVKKTHGSLHIIGLVSDGGVHSHVNHLYALLKLVKRRKIPRVYIHIITDGRDTAPTSALAEIQKLEAYCKEIGVGEIATVSGRYFAMDRDHNWERTDKALSVLTSRKGELYPSSAELIQDMYVKGITDEFIPPSLVAVSSEKHAMLSEGDGVIMFNFRTDRPRQIVERILQRGVPNLTIATLTRYNPNYPVLVAFEPIELRDCLGEVLSRSGIRQIRITETEKFAHLSYFLNCKQEDPFPGEDRTMYDSYSDIPTHDLRPEMRTPDITHDVVKQIRGKHHRVIFTNICNGDMVGHTGNIPATIKGVEAVDRALGKITEAALTHGYVVLITADHGNAEEMIDEETGQMLTSHSTNPVPFILVSKHYKSIKTDRGLLTDIAPTMLTILGLEIPSVMTGKSFV